MLKSIFLFCVSILLPNLYAKHVSFIDPCKWDDKKCLITSAQKAVPYFADGIPDLGMSRLDPMDINEIAVNEGGLNIAFKHMRIKRLKECHIMNVERNIQEHWLNVVLECPIDVQGEYTANGKILFVNVVGDGPFNIKSEKIAIDVKVDLNTVNNYWKVSNCVHKFEFKEKATLDFKNLFNGDETKAGPVLQILNHQWKDVVQSIGAPIVAKVVDRVYQQIIKLTDVIPANELEL